MELQGRKNKAPISAATFEKPKVRAQAGSTDETIHQLTQKALERLKTSSLLHEQNLKTEHFLHDTLVTVFEKLHVAFNAVAFIPSTLIIALGSVATRFSGKVENKTFAKSINNLATLLKGKLSASADVEGVFKSGSSNSVIFSLIEIVEKNPKKIKNMDSIEGIKIDPLLIAESLTELGRRYFDSYAKDKLIRRKGNEMAEALAKVQDAFNWIVENKEKTHMGWTSLMVSATSLFKLMKAENQTIYFKGAAPVEKEFLNLVLNKLKENPGDLQREKMLFPIMNQFAKAKGETQQRLLNSLKTIEFNAGFE